jgi:hypothetical protein
MDEQLWRGNIAGLVVDISSLMNKDSGFGLSLLFEVLDNSRCNIVFTV